MTTLLPIRTGADLRAALQRADRAEYPPCLLSARRAWFVAQIRERNDDPRTDAERALDEFAKEVLDTRKSDYPY